MVKGIAVYGAYVAYEPVRQRYWKWIYHRTGAKAGEQWYKRRVWRTTKAMKKVMKTGRYEFHGPGGDLYRAVIEAKRRVPRGHVEVSAEEFLMAPEEYSQEGYWVESKVVS